MSPIGKSEPRSMQRSLTAQDAEDERIVCVFSPIQDPVSVAEGTGNIPDDGRQNIIAWRQSRTVKMASSKHNIITIMSSQELCCPPSLDYSYLWILGKDLVVMYYCCSITD